MKKVLEPLLQTDLLKEHGRSHFLRTPHSATCSDSITNEQVRLKFITVMAHNESIECHYDIEDSQSKFL